MKFLKKKFDEMDDSILDELISKCEDAMVSPLKKKKSEVEVVVEAEPEEEGEGYAASEDSDEELSEEDKQKLLEIYSKIKG
jgi:hypothetical protein